MPRDFKVYLDDIRSAAAKIRRYTAGLSFDALQNDERTVDAVVRNLEIIGEAVKQLPAAIRAQHQDVDWKRIAGFRDILAHEYFGIDLEIVWDILQSKLPALEVRVRPPRHAPDAALRRATYQSPHPCRR